MSDHKPVVPVPNELLRFDVRSDRDGKPYKVDLAAYKGNGTCECPHFQIRLVGKVLRAESGQWYRCKHIERARDYFLDEWIARMTANGLVHDDAKQR